MRSKSALNYLIFGPDLPWNQSIADHFQVTQCYASSGWEFFPFPHKFLPQGLFFNTQSERKSPFLTGYTTLLAFWTKLHTLISHEEWHAVRRWDRWHGQLPSLQTAVLIISLWQKPQQTAGHRLCCCILSSPVLAPVLLTELGGCCEKIQWEIPQINLSKGSTISRIHFVHILLAGGLEVARAVDLLQLLVVRNGWEIVTSPALRFALLPWPHRSSSCPPSPPHPLFGTDLKPPWVTQWARRLRLGFVKMKPF